MEDGVWRTIGGRKVYIKKGQSLSDAMKESGKFTKKEREDEFEKSINEGYEKFHGKTDKEAVEIMEKDPEKYGKVKTELTDEDKENLKKLEEIIKKDQETGNTANRLKMIEEQQRYDRLYNKNVNDNGMSEEQFKKLYGERPETGLEFEKDGKQYNTSDDIKTYDREIERLNSELQKVEKGEGRYASMPEDAKEVLKRNAQVDIETNKIYKEYAKNGYEENGKRLTTDEIMEKAKAQAKQKVLEKEAKEYVNDTSKTRDDFIRDKLSNTRAEDSREAYNREYGKKSLKDEKQDTINEYLYNDGSEGHFRDRAKELGINDKKINDAIREKTSKGLTEQQKRLLEMKRSGQYKDLLGDNDEKSMKEAEARLLAENKTYKASDLEKGKPYEIDMGNGIKKTAIYMGKDENGNSSFYDGEGVGGTFGFSDKFINEKLKISDNKDDDKFIQLHNEINKPKKSMNDTIREKAEKKKLGSWHIDENGKKVYSERELGDDERGYWTKENGKRVYKENPNYKEPTLNDKFYTRKDGTREYDPYKGTPYEKKYDSVADASKDPNSAMNQYIKAQAEKKAYKKYLKQHPDSKLTLEEFKKSKKK